MLSATRILLLRAQSDESLALVARGGGDEYTADFDAVMKALGRANGSSGLLADAAKLARRTGSTASFADVVSTLRRYRAVHRRIGALEGAGRFVPAVALAVGHGTTEAGLARRLDADLESQIAAAQSRFEHAAADATSSLRALWPGILLLTISAVALTLFGFALRTKEYR